MAEIIIAVFFFIGYPNQTVSLHNSLLNYTKLILRVTYSTVVGWWPALIENKVLPFFGFFKGLLYIGAFDMETRNLNLDAHMVFK